MGKLLLAALAASVATGAVAEVTVEPTDAYSAYDRARIDMGIPGPCRHARATVLVEVGKNDGAVKYALYVLAEGLRAPGSINEAALKGGEILSPYRTVLGDVHCGDFALCSSDEGQLFVIQPSKFAAIAAAGGLDVRVSTSDGPKCDFFIGLAPDRMQELTDWAKSRAH